MSVEGKVIGWSPTAAAITGPQRRPGREVFRTAGSVVLVAAIFGFAISHFGSYRSVWASMHAMTWAQALLVAAAAAASMASTWIMICAVLPSIRLREAAVVNLGSNAVANTLPAGGALAMGVSWAMLSSWGISTAEYVLYTLVSGIWNVFARLGLPGGTPTGVLRYPRITARLPRPGRRPGRRARLADHRRYGREQPHLVAYLPPVPLGAIACLTWRHAPALIHAKPVAAGQPADMSPSDPT